MDAIVRLTQEIGKLWRAVRKLQVTGFQRPTWLTTSLTSTSFDGDSFSTTAKTLIDLSAVFGAPANIKAILVNVVCQDSGSAAAAPYFLLSPNGVAGDGISTILQGVPNDNQRGHAFVCPCDANGDFYYQCVASGASTLDVWVWIWAYWL